jgi:colanic acid/amylovoran biosynthesis protein
MRAGLFLLGKREELAAFDGYLRAIREADLFLVAGMGGITDAFPEYASGLLNAVILATNSGCYVALMGQGLGPLENEELRDLARIALPRVDRICLREGRAGLPLLRSLGVADDKVAVTGDDAIGLVFAGHGSHDPNARGLGVNIRLSDYSKITATHLETLRNALRRAATALSAELVPVPISTYPQEDDAGVIRGLMDLPPDGAARPRRADDLAALMDDILRCRVVATGSYHAAVFALANGIPVVGLAGSDYYRDKFQGLSDLFGDGCLALSVDEPEAVEKAILQLWKDADRLRPALLAEAAREMEAGRDAYAAVCREAMRRSRPKMRSARR